MHQLAVSPTVPPHLAAAASPTSCLSAADSRQPACTSVPSTLYPKGMGLLLLCCKSLARATTPGCLPPG